MIQGKRILGIVAARGGSKGLPKKNILQLGGKPLIAWSIIAAAGSQYLDRTIVSTDNNEIAEIARSAGGDVPFVRPTELGTDDASIIDVVLHAVDNLSETYDYVMLLQATSPLRTSSDIDETILVCRKRDASACVSVTPVTKGPWWMHQVDQDGYLHPFLNDGLADRRRQEYPRLVMPNGAVYLAELEYLRSKKSFYGDRTIAYEMPPERSPDIDAAIDFKLAEVLLDARDRAKS
jgi:N-acylneuraminate cytidylyltransferase